MKSKFSFVLAICLAGFFYASCQAGNPTVKETIKKMFTERTLPAMTLSDMNGEKVNLSDLHKDGKLTIVSFWATWCTPCKKELSNIHNLYEEWQKKYNVQVVAVSIDDVRNQSKVKTYVNGQAWDYLVLMDLNQDLKRALNIQTVPFTFLVDKNGKIVYEHSSYVEGDEFELEKKLEEYK